MQTLHDRVCRTANKISLHMDYVVTSKDPAQTPIMLKTAISFSRELLSRIQPLELQIWVEQLVSTFNKNGNDLTRDPSKWSKFVARECDRLHDNGLYEKSIQIIGTLLSDWDCKAPTYAGFANSLDCLNHLVTDQVDQLASLLQKKGDLDRVFINATEFALMHNSLAVVFCGISNAAIANNPKGIEAATAVSFGCANFNHCLNSINRSIGKSA